MNSTQLREIGRKFFGYQWRKKMSAALGVKENTLRGWMARDNVPRRYTRLIMNAAIQLDVDVSDIPIERTKVRVWNNGHLFTDKEAA